MGKPCPAVTPQTVASPIRLGPHRPFLGHAESRKSPKGRSVQPVTPRLRATAAQSATVVVVVSAGASVVVVVSAGASVVIGGVGTPSVGNPRASNSVKCAKCV